MFKLKSESWKDVIFHYLLATALIIATVAFTFYIFLPIKTNHGESITVPDIVGKNVNELEDFLGRRDLRFEVTPDSGFSMV